MPPGRWILIVDDDPSMCELLAAVVDAMPGFRSTTAPDTHQGFVQARDLKPALVIADLNMPGGYGTQILEELRKDPKTKDIPFIFVTGMELSKVAPLFPTKDKRVRVIPKPVDMANLQVQMNELLNPAEAAPAKELPKRFLADAGLFIDAFDKYSAGHTDSLRALSELGKRGIAISIPAHAWFDVQVAIQRLPPENRVSGPNLDIITRYPVHMMAIDQQFVEAYTLADIPEGKSWDPIFAAIAQMDKLPLISWDRNAISALRRRGGSAMTPSELLLSIGAPA